MEQFPRLFGFATVAPQNGVDEPGLGLQATLFTNLHGLVHGSVGRDAIEPEHLVKREAKEILDERLLWFAAGPLGNEPIEGHFPAHDPIHEFLQEASILGFEVEFCEGRLEKYLYVRTMVPFGKEISGNFSWFFRAH
jgi:hypothetical protein